MSSRGSYSQKKKREAVRRLSQQHSRQAARASSSSLFSNEPLRRRKSLEKRRSHDEAGPGTRQRRRDEGKRFISPMNNPDLASSTSAPNTAGGLFGKPSNVAPNSSESASELFRQGKTESTSGSALFPQASTAGTSLFSQASSSGTSLFSQKSSFGGTSAGLFGKPSVSSSSSLFGSQSSTFGSFGTKPSLFGQGIDSDSSLEDAGTKQPSFQVTFDSGGDDEAGIGRTVETADAPRSDRRVLTRDSAARETERSSGSFGQSSPLRDEETSRRRTSLKRELSPSKPSSASQRLLTSHDDVFESDISDLESFGSAPSKPKVEKESMQGRAAVKRSGLFERAIDDASGRREAVFKKQRSEERSPKESLRGQKQSSVFVSSSEVKHLTTIVVKDVLEELNNRIFLNKFFSKFGRVKKITVSPRKAMATVYFEDHKSAAQAKRDVKTLKLGTSPVTIFWTQRDKSKEKRKSDENVPPPNIETKTEVDPPQKREKPPAPPPASSVGRSTKGYHTASERYDALEERDKQIRKGMTKQSDLATAKKMTGTCPDMCPEKERYMREVQRRLSPYETDTGKVEKGENPHVCHTKAVKEYSRSSADQEEPLPSELRPPAVLDLTMNYLMGEIMNREPTGMGGDGRSWADWFDFLWNRTRSIRKEITQQQLCGITAVSLMEKCARFHIYCSYRLCEEGHMAFDPKINNENLTKCLQSLKQFYHDLADEGVFCPNEAEFRAYEVLLNLTGGDILREVQQYRPEVRNSEAVVFSLKVSAAFSSNNYCRFFKLIRAASFLNACILHRYFVQLRCLALETMNKAFTTPKGVSMFPTAELVHLMAFEDNEQASMFCECHGLRTVDGCIQLSRGGFYYPEETLTSQRAPSVIEAKNERSIGEVVNNGPLPVAPPHTPFSSFDENGRLLERVVEAKPVKDVQQAERKVEIKAPQESIAEITQQQVQQDISTAKVEESKPSISSEIIKDITKELFLEVIDDMVRDLSTRFMDTLAIIQASPQVLADIMQEELGVLSRRVAMETLEEEKYAEAKRKAAAEEASRKEKEMNALRQEASREISGEIIEEVVERTLQEIIVNEISAYQSELRKEAMDRCSSAVSEELLQDLVRSEVTDISSEVIAVATAERDRRLEEIAEAYRLRQLAYLYQKWCRVHTKRVKIRRALETFPAGPPNQNTAEQLEVLWPKRREQSGGVPSQVDTDMVLKSRLPLPMSLDTPYGVVSERESLAKHIMHHHYLTLVRQQRAWEPLDLPIIHSDNARSSQHASSPTRQHAAACRYWKLVALLPQGSHDDRSPCNWLKAKLRRGKISEQLRRSRLRDNESVETLSLYTQRVGSRPLGVCTKAMIGPPGGKHVRYQLMGNSGIILMVEGETQACFRDAGQRLKAALSQTPSRPSLPVIVCVVSDEDLTAFQSDLSHSMQLHQLIQEGVISCWKLIRIPRDVVRAEASEQLEEGLAWLASHHPDPPSVVSEMVKEYLDNGVTQFFSTSVHQLSKQRRETGQFPLSPQSIVSLYNSVMDHLASVASSSSLSHISWPPAEFTSQQHPDLPAADWNTPASLTGLYTTINTLQLPEMPYVEDSGWLSVFDACVSYVHRLPGRNSDKAPLLSRVRWLLDKSKRTFEDTCFMTFDTEGCEPTSQHAPWADILEECVTYMMTNLGSGQEGESPSLGSQQVYFHQAEFNKFEFPIEWKQEMNETLEESVAEHESMQHSIVEAVSVRQSTLVEEEQRKREERRRRRAEERLPDNTSFLLPEDVTMTISHTQSGLLRRMLDKEREENLRFEAMLTSFLEEEPVQSLQQRLHVQADKSESEFRLQLPPLPKASLTKSLEDPHPKTDAPTITLEDTDDTLSDQIQSLKERLASEKQAALMAEMRLNALLGL